MNAPDSIEPVEGWKALRIIHSNNGPRLLSPHYSHIWHPQGPTSSRCHITQPYWTPFANAAEATESLQEAEKWRRNEKTQQLHTPTLVGYNLTATYVPPSNTYQPASESASEHKAITPAGKMGPAPAIMLPGKHWGIQRRRVHPPGPDQNCACGIYIASEAEVARQYMLGHTDTVLVKVAGWGVVIPHDRGWRVQYAYPKQIHLNQENEYAGGLAEAYGCTIVSWNNKRTLNPPPAGTEVECPYTHTRTEKQRRLGQARIGDIVLIGVAVTMLTWAIVLSIIKLAP